MYKKTRSFSGRNQFRSNYRTHRNNSFSRGSAHKQSINPSRFVKAASAVNEETEFVPKNKFEDFALHSILKSNVASMGFVLPTHIQDEAIPVGLEGRDIVGIANTGTGKTAAFALPILNKLIDDPQARALIVAPTRELAQQIEAQCRVLAKGSGLRGAILIGGTAMAGQLRDLRANPSIVIGTPGRIKDHIERRTLVLDDFKVAVLDEVDRMVDMGFINDIRFILGKLALKRQSYFFSATLDPKLESLVQSFLTDPVSISVKTGETSDNVHQAVLHYTSKEDKLDKLHDTLISEATKKALVFDATKHGVERLSNELKKRGFKADAIHGGKSQGQRQRALESFKKNRINILVATDVAARGIDVVDITHVINYSEPSTYDDYIHRIGRAGRAGRIGHALTFISS